VSEIAGGRFYRAVDTEALKSIFAEIDKLEKSTVQYKKYQEYTDLYPLFVSVGLALVAIEMVMGQTVLRRLP
jgi:Ca-activated chloride channel family protein